MTDRSVVFISEVETWLPVVTYEGLYEVSNLGRIRSSDRITTHRFGGPMRIRGRMLKPGIGGRGYPLVVLCFNGLNRTRAIHQLVAEAFIGPRPSGMDICHKDGDRTNCTSVNLRYDTRKGNIADMLVHGTLLRGEKQGMSKLTNEQVIAIRNDSRSQREVAIEHGITRSNVSVIRRRKSWAWL